MNSMYSALTAVFLSLIDSVLTFTITSRYNFLTVKRKKKKSQEPPRIQSKSLEPLKPNSQTFIIML